MYSKYLIIMLLATFISFSCSPYRRIQKIRSGEVMIGLSVPAEPPVEEEEDVSVKIDSIRGELSEGPIIMNAIRDSETGEMVASDVIVASKVTARFRNVAERAGYVTIGFDITVPAAMADSRWQLKIRPKMLIQSDTLALDPVYITGSGYRAGQLRGYERYRAFLATIITDTADLVHLHQLEVFLQRHFPETYAMKNDSSLISEPLAANLFGVTQRDALQHYTSHLRLSINERRKARAGRLYSRYVKDPIVTEGIRLDTVLVGADGDFTYCYEHTFRSRPHLRKVMVALDGDLYEMGEQLRPTALVVTLETIQNRVIANRKRGKYTWVFIDEVYLYFKYHYSAEILYRAWKRFRKYGGILTAATQNVEECLDSDTARLMFANSEFLMLFNQAATDREKLAQLLHISENQMGYVTDAEPGHGLLRMGAALVPFSNTIPSNTELYRLMNTSPSAN